MRSIIPPTKNNSRSPAVPTQTIWFIGSKIDLSEPVRPLDEVHFGFTPDVTAITLSRFILAAQAHFSGNAFPGMRSTISLSIVAKSETFFWRQLMVP